jgi:hypothetical protein
MYKKEALERHKEARRYKGKTAELHCAEWIETLGWQISNLEALGGSSDIEAISPNNQDCAIEVKYIGVEDDLFLSSCESLAGGNSVVMLSSYSASNFLVFKVYEGANQLRNCVKRRIVFLVIANLTWNTVKIEVNEDWMQWDSPRFFQKDDPAWETFLDRQRKKFPTIDTDLNTTIGLLHELWIIREGNELEYIVEKKIRF